MKKHTVDELPDYVSLDHIAFTSSDDIKKMMKPLREKFGITYLAHSIVYCDGYATTLISDVDVMIHWVVEQFSLPGSNPAGPKIPSGSYFVPYLDDIYPIPYRKAMSEIFHVDNMLMIVESSEEQDELFCFATEPDNRKIVNVYFNNLDVFRRFITSFKIKADHLIKLAIKERVPVSLSLSDSIETHVRELVLPDHEKKLVLNELNPKKIPIDNGLYLTAREVDCLLLCSQGKSATKIAKTIAISNRTVEMHLENAKRKLGCNRKSQLLNKFFKIIEQYHISQDLISKS